MGLLRYLAKPQSLDDVRKQLQNFVRAERASSARASKPELVLFNGEEAVSLHGCPNCDVIGTTGSARAIS